MKKDKKFPKLKKSLKNFLTDESGKITKKDALGLSIGAMIVSGAENAFASGHGSHGSGTGHLNRSINDTGGSYNASGFNLTYGATCNHASGIVNGHYSSTPSTATTNLNGNVSHSSHGSSHGSCGRGHW